MTKVDLTKTDKVYYSAKTEPEIIELQPANYLAVDGTGDPSLPAFSKDIEALYTVAYTLKFLMKAEGKDFVVSKLEGLWWFDESKFKDTTIETAPSLIPREEWNYTLLIRMPDYVKTEHVTVAKENALTKKNIKRISEVRFTPLHEGKVVQIMHVGSFKTESVSLAKVGAFVKDRGLLKNGKHHEIYLSDFRKTPEQKLKTILREPVR